jgi:hypothetical protein
MAVALAERLKFVTSSSELAPKVSKRYQTTSTKAQASVSLHGRQEIVSGYS